MNLCILLMCLFFLTAVNACYKHLDRNMVVSLSDEEIKKYNLSSTGVQVYLEMYTCNAHFEKEEYFVPSEKIYVVKKQICPENCKCQIETKTYEHSEMLYINKGVSIAKVVLSHDVCRDNFEVSEDDGSVTEIEILYFHELVLRLFKDRPFGLVFFMVFVSFVCFFSSRLFLGLLLRYFDTD